VLGIVGFGGRVFLEPGRRGVVTEVVVVAEDKISPPG
jgi:hypothetical protein